MLLLFSPDRGEKCSFRVNTLQGLSRLPQRQGYSPKLSSAVVSNSPAPDARPMANLCASRHGALLLLTLRQHRLGPTEPLWLASTGRATKFVPASGWPTSALQKPSPADLFRAVAKRRTVSSAVQCVSHYAKSTAKRLRSASEQWAKAPS